MSSLSLPEEFVLLLHKDNGGYHMMADYTAGAELGELALRGRVDLAGKKIRITDASPSGIAWIDDATALLRKLSGSEEKPVDAGTFFWRRKSRRKVHCAALSERQLMRHEQKSALLVSYDSYFPDIATREALVDRLRAAGRNECELDDRLVMLVAVVRASGLADSLGFDREERTRLKAISKGEDLGAVAGSAGPAAATLATMVTSANWMNVATMA
ncbi:GPP34 family phosphoprotein [Saccharopolyspora erythraea]|uniref:GOLPH3/VPS74 family protein n=1 Tax=Saccharopolyspora erythraea TaxID=1836 RepID=UPI001BA56F6A|nr:GPP34 family phosphoprotein [Saccharopolyspora erythraea]QUH03695.1 GPP34 family phosphoprotein [Saccharopolyspora erythraea]